MNKPLPKDEEERLNQAYKSGQSAGLQESAERVWKHAERRFRAGNDTDAMFLRTIAKEILDRVDQLTPGDRLAGRG